MSLSDEDRGRRLAAKRNNERLKLITTSLNAIGIAVFSAAVLLPAIPAPDMLPTLKPWILLSGAFLLHLGAHAVLGMLRSEG